MVWRARNPGAGEAWSHWEYGRGLVVATSVLTLAAISLAAGVQTENAPPSSSLAEQASEHNRKGVALAHHGNQRAALKEFRAAVRLKPNYGGAQYNLAATLENLDELDDAVKAYRDAARLLPDSPHVVLAL